MLPLCVAAASTVVRRARISERAAWLAVARRGAAISDHRVAECLPRVVMFLGASLACVRCWRRAELECSSQRRPSAGRPACPASEHLPTHRKATSFKHAVNVLAQARRSALTKLVWRPHCESARRSATEMPCARDGPQHKRTCARRDDAHTLRWIQPTTAQGLPQL